MTYSRPNPRPPDLHHVADEIYETSDPHGFAAWMRGKPSLFKEWDRRGKSPNNGGELTRFYLRQQQFPAPCVIVQRDGYVELDGPGCEQLHGILAQMTQTAPPRRPHAPRQIARPPGCLIALAEIAGVPPLWPCDTAYVKGIWRTVAKLTHPDTGGDHETFINARACYEVALAAVEARR